MTQSNRSKNKGQLSRSNLIIIGIVVAAVVIALVAIFISSSGVAIGGVDIDYSTIPQERTEDGAFVLGDPDAPVTVVAFEDFLCPACQQYEPTIKAFIEQYVATGQARFEYRFLPAVDPTYSTVAAGLAECADTLEPGSFWEAHDTLFRIASSQRFSAQSSRTFAEEMGIPYSDILDCQAEADQWRIDQELAQQMGVTGTPTVMIRFGDGPLQSAPFGTRPTLEALGSLVESMQSLSDREPTEEIDTEATEEAAAEATEEADS